MKPLTFFNHHFRHKKNHRRWLNFCLLFLLLFFGLPIHAQQNSSYVFASQGNYNESQNMSLSWTLGDYMIATVKNDQAILTQGFQQPLLIIKKIDTDKNNAFTCTIYPNPTRGMLTLEVFENSDAYQVEVLDIMGRSVKKLTTKEVISNIDLSNYSAGQYYVRLSSVDHIKVSVFEIIKL